MKIRTYYIVFFALFSFAFFSGSINELEYPEYFPKPVYDFSQNPLDNEKIKLGRALFYDPILSRDNTVSCATCHSVFNAFAHTDHELSHGIDDAIGTRNAPALINLAWSNSFMWDGAVNHLDMQALAPIEHPKEMGEKIETVIEKLNNSTIYPPLFFSAFGDSTATGEHLLKALAQFQLGLISANSKYDRIKRGEETFNDSEKRGYRLFLQNCNSCHTEPLFTTGEFANNGLPIDTTLNDLGRMTVTKDSTDAFKFKIPTLRNVEFSYPYMHDGRFSSLHKVLKHYNTGIIASKTLAPSLKDSIKISADERADLVAFLLSLSDKDFVFNPEFRFPRETLLLKKQ